jgi:short-subunit dehydrogenase
MHPLKPLSSQTIVITGGSSGIGLATALAAAKKGARLVLAARNTDALRSIVRQINDAGGTAAAVAADVSREDEVRKIVNAALTQFGGFDTWINDAGLGIYGRIEDVSIEDSRQLFDINFWGMVYGAREAAQHLKRKGGAIINLGSVASDMPLPLHGIYCASKHAVKGFTDTLRLELKAENSPVSVTLIKPASIGTPFFVHAKNYMDEEYKASAPVYAPEEVASAILYAATHRIRDIYVGGAGPLMTGAQRLMPSFMDWYQSRDLPEAKTRLSTRLPDGSLYEPGGDGKVHGDKVKGGGGAISVYTRAVTNPAITGATIATLTAAGALAVYAATRNNAGWRKYLS